MSPIIPSYTPEPQYENTVNITQMNAYVTPTL